MSAVEMLVLIVIVIACMDSNVTSWCVQGSNQGPRVPANHDRSGGDGISQPAFQHGSV